MVFEFDRTDQTKFPCAECMFQHVARQKTPECMTAISEGSHRFYPGLGKMTTANGETVMIKGVCERVEKLLNAPIVDNEHQKGRRLYPVESMDIFNAENGREIWDSIDSAGPPTIEEYNVLKKLVLKVMKEPGNTALFTLYLSCWSQSELKKCYGGAVDKRIINVINGVGKKLLEDALKPVTVKWSDGERLKDVVVLKLTAGRINRAKEIEKRRRRWKPYFLRLSDGSTVMVLREYSGKMQLRHVNLTSVHQSGIITLYSTTERHEYWEVEDGYITQRCILDKKTGQTSCELVGKSGSSLSKDLSAAEFKKRWLSKFLEGEV